MLFTGQMVVGDSSRGCLRYGRAPSEMSGISLRFLNRSVGEPAEGSLPWGFVPIEIAPFVYEYPLFPRRVCLDPPLGPPKKTFAVAVPSVNNKNIKTFNNGSLGSGIDEERSEMR